MKKASSNSQRLVQRKEQFKAPKSSALEKFILGNDEKIKIPETEKEAQEFLKELGITDYEK
jgi:hypothetical protein